MDCTVVIPVGPGHKELAKQAQTSVMLASEHRGPFEHIHIMCGDDTAGEMGRSETRNMMVFGTRQKAWMDIISTADTQLAAFESEWLFFLDADDLMTWPPVFVESAFEVAGPLLEEHDCIWGGIYELHQKGEVVKRDQVEALTTFEEFLRYPVAQTCQMGHFVRREVFKRLGGFNVLMDFCEDVDLYLREWRGARCVKQPKPLFLNRRGFHSWMREAGEGERPRPTGRDWSVEAARMMEAARNTLGECT